MRKERVPEPHAPPGAQSVAADGPYQPPGDVADPWYTGDFEATWQDVLEGCTALLEELRSEL